MILFFFFSELVGSNCFFFFFQAEDGIRARTVTGVQTCALPIFAESSPLELTYFRTSGAGDSCPWMNAIKDRFSLAAGSAPKKKEAPLSAARKKLGLPVG